MKGGIMINPCRRQCGIGVVGVFFVIVLASVIGTVLIRLGPAYMSHWTLTSIMNGVAASPEPVSGGGKGILELIERRMDVNDIRGIDPKAFTVQRSGDNSYDVRVAYERREHLFFNLDAVLTFEHAVTVRGQ
jgi:Domain of unknown function (DUF4845)